MAFMSCPAKPMEEVVNPVLKVLNDNKEYAVLDSIEKGGMTLRSGRVLLEPSAKRLKMGGKRSGKRSSGKRSGKRSSKRSGKRSLTGGGNKELVLDGLASILAACTVTSGFLSMWCSFGPVISTFVTGFLTKNLEPQCADTFKISGYDTGFGFARGLSGAMRLITGADSCGAIDEQHAMATVRIEVLIMQLVSVSAFMTSLTYPQVKKFWTIILLACINVSQQTVSAVSSFMQNFFTTKVDLTVLKPDFNKLFINDVVKEILKEITAEDVKDPTVVKALEKASDILQEKNTAIAPDILREAQQELNVLHKEASSPSRAASKSPEPMERQQAQAQAQAMPRPTPRPTPRPATPRAESLVPSSRPATEEPEDMSGGGKTNKRSKTKRSKSNKRGKSKHRKSNKRSKTKHRKSNKKHRN